MAAPNESGAGGGGGGFYTAEETGIGGAGGSGLVHVVYWNQEVADQIDTCISELKSSLGSLPGQVAASVAFVDTVLKSTVFDQVVKNKVDAYLNYLKEKEK